MQKMFRASQIYGAPPGSSGPAVVAAAGGGIGGAEEQFQPDMSMQMPAAPQAPLAPVGGPPSLPAPQNVAAALAAAAAGAGAAGAVASGGSGSFEAASAFAGARPGKVFKLGSQGLGYYLDSDQTMLSQVRPQLPERWREAALREERLRVDPRKGAGLSLEYSKYGFAVEAVEPEPGQQVCAGEVIVAMEGRLLVGLSAPQMQASFQKRRVDGARLQVANLAQVKDLDTRDPAIVECWDARHQHVYYFHKRTAKTAWTREELQAQADPLAPKEGASSSSADAKQQAPIDIASFLSHGFAKPKEPDPKKKRKAKPEAKAADGELAKDESDLAREERKRWGDWNEGGQGGYTQNFLARYRNCTSWESKPKEDKRLKGSVGPGHGNEYIARWTGSKNSFN